MSEYPCQYTKAAPDLGEDNFAIFEELGFSEEKLNEYKENGALN